MPVKNAKADVLFFLLALSLVSQNINAGCDVMNRQEIYTLQHIQNSILHQSFPILANNIPQLKDQIRSVYLQKDS